MVEHLFVIGNRLFVPFLKLQQDVAGITVFDQLNIPGFIIVIVYKFSVTYWLHKIYDYKEKSLTFAAVQRKKKHRSEFYGINPDDSIDLQYKYGKLKDLQTMTADKISIRKSTAEDIPRLLEIFDIARKFMAGTGNPNQWTENYPGKELLRHDIENGDSYAIVSGSRIVATFVLRSGNDPTYNEIYDGAWLNDSPYATIHRIASSGEIKGIMHHAMQFALRYYQNIRIDTHRDNIVMQRAINKEGFEYCGVIHCWNGSERLAYQYVKR